MSQAPAEVPASPHSTLLALPLHTLLEGLAQLLCGDQLPDHLHLENLLMQDCLASPGFRHLATPALVSIITVILNCAYELASGQSHTAHSASAERTMGRSVHMVDASLAQGSDGWTSSDGQTFHVSAVIYPDGHCYIFPTPLSSTSLPRVEVSVLDAGDERIDDEYVDVEDPDDDIMPPLVDV
ncbi:hypothetical protein OH76DRAFT_1490254 [Lentinus brumalis]|uniref:Uncharacterized protein n=1 Tax=Lentinus brumalis TaxID=2498619 RepID=A0A371CJI8_9APHY|nr:hypothetical protein OH76DRAFT_1490254 [Polyporus brumalis]